MAKKLDFFVTEKQFNQDIKTAYQHYYVYDIYKSIVEDNSRVNSNENKTKMKIQRRSFDELNSLSKRSDLEIDIRDNHFNIFHDLYFFKNFELIWFLNNDNYEDESQPSAKMVYLLKLFSNFVNKEGFTVANVAKKKKFSCNITPDGMEPLNREMIDLGIIKSQGKVKYKSENFSVSKLTMKKLFESIKENCDEKESDKLIKNFISFLIFATEFYDFGKLGKELLYRLEHMPEGYPKISSLNNNDQNAIKPDCFKYKNNYIAGCLSEFNLIDIMYCIKSGDCFQEYTLVDKNKLIVKPLKIFTNCISGIQYVTVYLPEYRSLCNLNVAEINEIVNVNLSLTSEQEASINKDLEFSKNFWKDNTYEIIPNSFMGNLVEDGPYLLQEHTAKVILRITSDKKYKLNYLKAEYGERIIQTGDSEFQLCFSYLHIDEVIPKIRKLYGFIQSIDSEDNIFEIVKEDFKNLYAVYNNGKENLDYPNTEKKTYEKLVKLNVKPIKDSKKPHNLLYTHFFSKQVKNCFEAVSLWSENQISLEKAIEQAVNDDWPYLSSATNDNAINKEAKDERICEIKRFFELMGYDGEEQYVDDEIKLSGNFYFDTFPITSMEGMWLCWVLEDDYAKLFLDEKQIAYIKGVIDDFLKWNSVFEDNIFNCVENHKLFARAKRLPSRELFQKILYDTSHHINVNIEYNGKKIGNILPKYIEFSKKDNCIWLVTNRNSFLLHKIQKLTYSEKRNKLEPDNTKGIIKRKSVYVEFLNNTIEFKKKLLSELAPWKKNFKDNIRGSDGGYRVPNTIYVSFYEREENEIYNRLLSYGSEIKIYGGKNSEAHKSEDLKYIKNLLVFQKTLFETVDK